MQPRMTRYVLLLLIAVAAAGAATYALAEKLSAPVEEMGHIWLGQMKFATTLHATTKGMKYWYKHGIGNLTGVPYEKMFCSKCHATCESCHAVKNSKGEVVDFSAAKARDKETCFHCHGRQKLAYKMFGDVHMNGLGVSCTYCHSSGEVHGMHGDFHYMLEGKSVFNVTCEKCHLSGYAPYPYSFIDEHRVHLKDIACATCHSKTTYTCYSCHLSYAYEKYVKTGKPVKRAIKLTGWLLLVRDKRTGKIVPGNIMVVTWDYNGTKAVRVDIAQMFPHTVTAEGLKCKDCHGTPAAKELLTSGRLRLVWYENGEVKHLKGVIPIVEGTKLTMQTFVWDEKAGTFKPFKEITVTVGPNTLIENTAGLTLKDLEKMAKTPEELRKG